MRSMLGVIHLGIGVAVLVVASAMAAPGAAIHGKVAAFVAILHIVGGVGWAMGRDSCLWLLVGANSAICLFALWLGVIAIGRLFQPLPQLDNTNEMEALYRLAFSFAALVTLVVPALLSWALIRDALTSRRDERRH